MKLTQVRNVGSAARGATRKRHAFVIQTTDKEYLFQAPDAASLQTWLNAL